MDIKIIAIFEVHFQSCCRANGRLAGEYRLYPIDQETFDAWSESHQDYPHSIQFSKKVLVVAIMLPPHDGAAGIIMHGISRAVDAVCHPVEPELYIHTGRIGPLHEISNH